MRLEDWLIDAINEGRRRYNLRQHTIPSGIFFQNPGYHTKYMDRIHALSDWIRRNKSQ